MSTTTLSDIDKVIKYLNDKIELYLLWRKILYSMLDVVHNSPKNYELFHKLTEVQIRLDELYRLTEELKVK